MPDESPSLKPNLVLDPLRRALTLAKIQLVIGFLLMLGAPIAGRVVITLAWVWIADHFSGLRSAGVVNVEALAAFDNGRLGNDWINAVHSIVSPPLLWFENLFDLVGVVVFAWVVMSAVTCWQLSKATRQLQSPHE